MSTYSLNVIIIKDIHMDSKMPDLTKLTNFKPPKTRRNTWGGTIKAAQTLRKTPHRDKSAAISSAYLGFDVVKNLADCDATKNASLLEQVASLELKTQDMQIGSQALKRKASELANQAEIRASTVEHILGEAQKLGIAHNTENSAVVEFLKNMGIANAKADNKDAYAGIKGESDFRDEQLSFGEKVRKLYQAKEEKAIAYAQKEELAAKLKLIQEKQSLLDGWIKGDNQTKEVLEAYKELNNLRETREGDGTGGGSWFNKIGGFLSKAVGEKK